jgi:hypothetical protein
MRPNVVTTMNEVKRVAAAGRARMLLVLAALSLVATAAAAQAVPTTEVLIPVVGNINGVGAVRWKTDVEIDNNAGVATEVFLSLPTIGGDPFYNVTLAPGESIHAVDVLGQIFGIDGALSPLLITTTGRRPLLVRATAYSIRDGQASMPQSIPAILSGSSFPLRTLTGLSFSDNYRTNVGLLNLSEKAAPFVLALQRLEGRNLAVSRFTVPANTLFHVPIQAIFPLISQGDNFSIIVETNSTNSYVYASVIRNDTNEAQFIQPAIGAMLPAVTAEK